MRRMGETGDEIQDRGFPAPARSDEGNELTSVHRQTEVLQDSHLVERLRHCAQLDGGLAQCGVHRPATDLPIAPELLRPSATSTRRPHWEPEQSPAGGRGRPEPAISGREQPERRVRSPGGRRDDPSNSPLRPTHSSFGRPGRPPVCDAQRSSFGLAQLFGRLPGLTDVVPVLVQCHRRLDPGDACPEAAETNAARCQVLPAERP